MPSLSSVRLVGRCEPSTRRMISNFSMRDTSFVVAPIPEHAFFEKAQLQGLFGHDLFKSRGFPTQVLYLVRRCRTCCVPSQALLPSFKELLGPAVIQALGNTFAAAQLRDAVLPLQAVQHNPDLLFGRILFACGTADVLNNLLAVALACSRVSVSSPLLGGYDVPETLSYQIDLNCPIGADVRQSTSSAQDWLSSALRVSGRTRAHQSRAWREYAEECALTYRAATLLSL